ncbi:ATP-binding cassette sub-family A member 2-like [Uloborus diversus]|uniref:ATP-binding cassette sub-family A member 2-like n=1 Tax=Uloborus diversus TaxID=327109 RepID=UPI002409BD53|nr:ATP-binding cassette sub-family A member 2-like [Uloborus diversus]
MGICLQLKLLLWKNFTLKKRKPVVLIFELFIPLVLFFILLGIRKKQPAYPVSSFKFSAYPLPSAGVIAVMQAFCDNGVRSDDGFAHFPNSSVTEFLGKLNNVSQKNNFFQPDFTPSDMDEIPDIYKSIIEDPVAVHDSFRRAADTPIGELISNKSEFIHILVSNLSLPQDDLEVFLNSSLDPEKLYTFLFGKFPQSGWSRENKVESYAPVNWSNDRDQPLFIVSNSYNSVASSQPSLEHLYDLIRYLEKHRTRFKVVWSLVEKIFNSQSNASFSNEDMNAVAEELKSIILSPSGLRELMCNKEGLPFVLKNDDVAVSNATVELQSSFCNLNDSSMKLISDQLEKSLDAEKLREILHLDDWNITLAHQRLQKLADDLVKFNEFEIALKQLSDLASSLPQDACLTPNDTLSLNDSSSYITDGDSWNEHPKKAVRSNPQYGLLRIWLGMQKTICGKEGDFPTSLPKDGDEIDFDKLGMSKYQQEQIGILVHVLYSNPRVLYAPNNTAADEIITKANETFELLDTVTQYAQKMLNISEEIRIFLAENSTDHSLAVLKQIHQNFQKYPLFLQLFHSLALEEFAANTVIIDKDVFLQQLDSIDNAACSWISLMSGLSLNMFQGFRNEDDLLGYFKNEAYFDNVTVLASVIFNMTEDGSMPNHMTYKIRQNASFTTTTNLVRSRFWFPGPRNWGYGYYQFGFVWIQDVLERAMISIYAGHDVTEPGTYIHQFPYPCYIQDQFLFMIEHVMPLCLAISWVYSVSMLVQNIVYEKEQRLKEVMKTMGLNSAVHWLAWFITSFLQMTITAALLTVILKYGLVLTYSNPLLIFLMLEIFVVANIAFSFLVSVLYSKAKLAAACAGIIYFLTYVPYMYIAVREEAAHDHIPVWLKSLASLLSTTAFGLGAKYFAFYEEVGVGVQWSNIAISPVEDDEYSLRSVALMMITDAVLYSLLVWYIENVHPGSYGLPKPWYFPFTKSYWFSNSKSDHECSCLTDCWRFVSNRKKWGLSVIDNEQACAMTNRTADNQYFEPDPANLPLGVCVENLVKVYKSGNKVAVNKLSLNLYENQITSFLGHNGAGKTTTMSILTGLFPPSSGYAIIYAHDIRTEMDIIRQSMGMCPQHNVLFEELTVEEHLWFYASLKGLQGEKLNEEIDKMIEDLNLPLKRHSKVKALSGGMKRKLSVAIAFVGGSRVVILDEPTAGVDPYSRRAIWDLILKYKIGRTILLSTHHMDEADVLGDRIAIVSNGQLRCCGSPLFLKNNLGDGYHLYIVKNDEFNIDKEYNEAIISEFIKKHVSSAYLDSENKRELHYILPISELRKGSFERLFNALETSLPGLGISSFGIKNTTLEEVFLKVAEKAQMEDMSWGSESLSNKQGKSGQYDSVSHQEENGKPDSSPLPPPDGRPARYNAPNGRKRSADDGKADYFQLPPNQVKDSDANLEPPIIGLDGAGSYKVEGKMLLFQQFTTILLKRFYCTRRNWKGLFSQILLPAFFVSVAMSVALTAPKVEDLPPLTLSPSQYYNYTRPDGNAIPYSRNRFDIEAGEDRWSQDADSEKVFATLYMPSGVGATCVLKSPFNNSFDEKMNFSARNYDLLSAFFEPSCESVFVPGLPLDNFVPPPPTNGPHLSSLMANFTTIRTTESPMKYYPSCHCSDDKTGYICDEYYMDPPSFKVVTSDVLLDISGQNEHEYFLYTTGMYRLRRYGAFSFGLLREYVPKNFGKNAPPLFRKVAVRNVAKVWYNNKGYHSMPTYVNSINNAILRSNIPPSMGNPSAYGITVINHPMTDTSYLLSKDQIVQGTDVLIAIFIIVAMSFVPASFVLFLVYERYTKAKHLQFVSGVNAVIYWVANYFWDMCSYVVPATCCVLILLIFDIPAYTSHKNFPAVVSLFLIYGWSITPVMYPVSFLFKEPSTAYIFLIVINLFVGITCIVTSFLLEVFSEDAYLGEVHKMLKTTFLLFPNYCLGRGLMDIAFNEYQNFFLFKTGQYDKMKSPFAWDLVTRNLVAMAFSGLAFFFITLLCEFNFFRKPKDIQLPDYSLDIEDDDVAAERKRVLTGQANSDVLHLIDLTKIYNSRNMKKLIAVNKLCLGVPEGECLGLLGVNGAGKSTTFKMLTGDTKVTAGDAFLNGFSIKKDLRKVQQFIGYCPQFDALYDELTAREHLKLYSKFRGIPPNEEDKVIEWALKKLDLVNYADRVAGTYSGGNKRKLSTAIALLGAPAIIFLDEPTTGMDPYTRRFLWDLIIELVKSGRSVVLTSHSMEECEALCTRLAIMVNGNFKCLGSIQHLKNRFGEGYYIAVRTEVGELEAIKRWFRKTFPDARLKEQHYNSLQFELKSDCISLAYVFSRMELALQDLPIEEYSVCQNTLDNVFINFVKQQSDGVRDPALLSHLFSPTSADIEEALEDPSDNVASHLTRSQACALTCIGPEQTIHCWGTGTSI